MNINDLKMEAQQNIDVMVKEVDTLLTRTKEPYQRLSVLDADGNMATFLRFDHLQEIHTPMVCRVSVETSTYNQKPSIKVMSLQELPDADVSVYFPKAQIDENAAWTEFNSFYKKVNDTGYRLLLNQIFKLATGFKNRPFSADGLFTRRCGILEATLKLLHMAEAAQSTFELDANLLYTAALLYYVGNLDLVNEGYLNTQDDLLIGESNAAIRRVLQAESVLRNREHPVDDKTLTKQQIDLLLHVLTSRYGGMKSTIIESIVLKDLDYLVRRTEEAQMLIKDAEPGSVVNGYGKQRLLKL